MSKKKKIDIVEELEKILMEELKKIGATQDFSVEITDSPAFKATYDSFKTSFKSTLNKNREDE